MNEKLKIQLFYSILRTPLKATLKITLQITHE